MKRERLNKLLPWVWLGIVFITYITCYINNYLRILDADASSEMVLSSLLNKENAIISKNWTYSTEIRFLNTQLVYSFFMHIFSSWRAVRICSCLTFVMMLLGSFYYMCRQAGISKAYPYAAAFLIMPFSGDYANIVLYNFYYYPHIIISFLSVGLILNIENSKKWNRKKILLGVCLFVLSILAGIGGPRQLMILYIPMILAGVIRIYRNRKIDYYGIYISFVGGLVGYLINSKILIKTYKFNGWDSIRFQPFSSELLSRDIAGLLNSFGFVTGELFSFDLIRNAVCFIIIIGIIRYYQYYIKHKDVDKHESLIADFFICALVVFIGLYLFTEMFYEDRYYIPIIVFASSLFAFALDKHNWKANNRIAVIVVMSIFMVLGSYGNHKDIKKQDNTSKLSEIVAALDMAGYESGYATYWNGNIVSELSNGRIEMYTYDADASAIIDVDNVYNWLQNKKHLSTAPKGKVFILLSVDQLDACPLTRYLSDMNVAVRNDAYVAYGFSDYEEMLKQLSYWSYDMDNGDYIVNGTVSGGTYIIGPSGVITGDNCPNVTLYKGTYTLTVTGYGLNNVKNEVFAAFGETPLLLNEIEMTDVKQVYRIEVPNNVYNVVVNTYNLGQTDIVIDGIEIVRGIME